MKPFKFDTHVPMPDNAKHSGVMKALRERLKAQPPSTGHSWIYEGHTSHIYLAAKDCSIIIRTRKENGGGIRVWRVK
jgi:hypothetical protein